MSRVALTALLVLASPPAAAFSVALVGDEILRWRTSDLTYWLDLDGTAAIVDSTDLEAVRTAVRTWNDVRCSRLTINELATTAAEPFLVTDQMDGRNVIAWVEDERWEFGNRVLAVTTPIYNSMGFIQEADIAFNGFSVRWSTTTAFGTADIESVAVHELGHVFGLQHVLGGEQLADPPTLAPYVDPHLRTRTLTSDDAAGACFLYPEERYVCSDDDDCPWVVGSDISGNESYVARFLCESGSCASIVPVGFDAGVLGAPCQAQWDCANGLDCTLFADEAYCTMPCSFGQVGACEQGFTCVPVFDSKTAACIPDRALGGPNCPCNRDRSCEAACICDPDCACDCDRTDGCDACDCDPACRDGCTAGRAPAGGLASGVPLLMAAFVIIFARAVHDRRGGGGSGEQDR